MTTTSRRPNKQYRDAGASSLTLLDPAYNMQGSCTVEKPAHGSYRPSPQPSPRGRGGKNRSGIAAFEFVILLPVICSLIWVIFWFGFGMIYKNELTVECRREAWSKRYVEESEREWNSRPLLVFFIPELGIGSDQFISESDTKKVSDLKFFSGWSDVGSKHVVLAGSWDHREVDLTEPLSLKLPSAEWMAHASAYGKVGDPIIVANTGMELYWRGEQTLEGIDNTKNKIDNAYQMFSTDLFRDAGVSLGADAIKNQIENIVKDQLKPENLLNELVDSGLFGLL